ncbi:MAG: SDR family NAD(P)-dependent oxidoreductase [Pseudomonadota bacterium]
MSGEPKRRFSNPASAILTALRDIRNTDGLIHPSPDHERLDGKTCLITGANSGLGFAIAVALARRGATLILACRSGISETAARITAETGHTRIRMEAVDLLDLTSVDALCARLAERGETVDRLILNAGLMAPKSVPSAQGFESMLAVHYLANFRLIERCISHKIIQVGANGKTGIPRIIAISSESHRSAPPIDWSDFGKRHPHGPRGAMAQYGHSKLALSLMIEGLARKYRATDGTPLIGLFHMCPGPVNTNIARGAPALLRPIISTIMGTFFPAPLKAALPAVYLTASTGLEGRSGDYMHLMRFKDPSDAVRDKKAADQILAFGEAVFAKSSDW